MSVTPALVKELRDKTGCGMMDCKRALEESGADVSNAVKLLREKGLADLSKRSERKTNEGLVDAYIHGGGRIAVLVEVNCETDFVARNDDFRQFAHDVAMQVAAANPQFVTREEVPKDLIKAEREIYKAQALQEGKPEQFVDKIIEGRMEKFFHTVCLMEQNFIKDQEKTVQNQLGELVSKIGENVTVKRFTRFQLGEEV